MQTKFILLWWWKCHTPLNQVVLCVMFVYEHLATLTSKSYKFPMFLLNYLYMFWLLFSHYFSRFLKYLFLKMKYFQIPQLLYQFYELHHLSIRNNFSHIIFLMRTLLFCMNCSISFTKYLFFFTPISVWILQSQTINFKTLFNTLLGWGSVY